MSIFAYVQIRDDVFDLVGKASTRMRVQDITVRLVDTVMMSFAAQ